MPLSLGLELERRVYGDDEALRGVVVVHNGGSTPVYLVERRLHPHAEPGRLSLCACVHQVDALTCFYDHTPPEPIELAPGGRRSLEVELPLATWRLRREPDPPEAEDGLAWIGMRPRRVVLTGEVSVHAQVGWGSTRFAPRLRNAAAADASAELLDWQRVACSAPLAIRIEPR